MTNLVNMTETETKELENVIKEYGREAFMTIMCDSMLGSIEMAKKYPELKEVMIDKIKAELHEHNMTIADLHDLYQGLINDAKAHVDNINDPLHLDVKVWEAGYEVVQYFTSVLDEK